MLLKTVYDRLVIKVNAIDPSKFVFKNSKCSIDKSGLEKKIDYASK